MLLSIYYVPLNDLLVDNLLVTVTLGCLAVAITARRAGGGAARSVAVGACLSMLLLLKSSGVLFALYILALMLLWERPRKRAALRSICWAFILPLLVFAAWRCHVFITFGMDGVKSRHSMSALNIGYKLINRPLDEILRTARLFAVTLFQNARFQAVQLVTLLLYLLQRFRRIPMERPLRALPLRCSRWKAPAKRFLAPTAALLALLLWVSQLGVQTDRLSRGDECEGSTRQRVDIAYQEMAPLYSAGDRVLVCRKKSDVGYAYYYLMYRLLSGGVSFAYAPDAAWLAENAPQHDLMLIVERAEGTDAFLRANHLPLDSKAVDLDALRRTRAD